MKAAENAITLTQAKILSLPVILAALGYFVDVMDIWIFAANRVASLQDLGVPADKILDTGVYLLNMQMGGLFLGGLLFGVLGDKFGRTKIMFASILTYSLATLANAFVQDIHTYAALRFISGIGLAGELGLAITLISEILPKEKRGYGTGIIAGFGIMGAVAAALMAQVMDWRVSYAVGGIAGLILLAFRMKVAESELFHSVPKGTRKGSLLMLFTSRERTMRFVRWVCMILPIWFVAGIMVTFGPEIIKTTFGFDITAATLIIISTTALAIGDFTSAWVSQLVKNRRVVVVLFTFLSLLAFAIFINSPFRFGTASIFALYVLMSFGTGCWILGITASGESFGTNLRATVTTAVPNFARGSTILTILAVAALKDHMPLTDAVLWVGLTVYLLAFWAVWSAPETFGKPLDYLEE
jgi:putative MFS transporter